MIPYEVFRFLLRQPNHFWLHVPIMRHWIYCKELESWDDIRKCHHSVDLYVITDEAMQYMALPEIYLQEALKRSGATERFNDAEED